MDTQKIWHLLGKRCLPWLLGVFSGMSPGFAQQQKPTDLQVSVWATSCMACHGPDGRAEGTGLSLHGRSADDLLGKLLGYKAGKLRATMMHQHAKGYSDDELRRIAAYFASLK